MNNINSFSGATRALRSNLARNWQLFYVLQGASVGRSFKNEKNKPISGKDFHYNHGYGIRFSKEIDTKPTKISFQKAQKQRIKKKNKKGS